MSSRSVDGWDSHSSLLTSRLVTRSIAFDADEVPRIGHAVEILR